MDRRDFLKTSTAAAIASGAPTPARAAFRQPDLIKTENAKAGASFQLTRMRPDSATSYRTSLIEGYCSHQSVKAGEKLDIFVSTKPVAQFTLDIFRMGYYDGIGSRLMTKLGPFEGKEQPVPEMVRIASASASGKAPPRSRFLTIGLAESISVVSRLFPIMAKNHTGRATLFSS
jgi:hypothetical protein